MFFYLSKYMITNLVILVVRAGFEPAEFGSHFYKPAYAAYCPCVYPFAPPDYLYPNRDSNSEYSDPKSDASANSATGAII